MIFSDNTLINWLLGIAATLGSMLVSAWGYIFFKKAKQVDDMQMSKVDRDHFENEIRSIKNAVKESRAYLDRRIDEVNQRFIEEHRITRNDITELVKSLFHKE